MAWQIALLVASLGCSQAFAAPTHDLYTFDQQKIEITNFREQRITVSSACAKNDDLKICGVESALQKVSFRAIEHPRQGGSNPGSLICTQQLSGVVLIGREVTSKNENSFCQLKDGSLVENGTLTYYGLMNDRTHLADKIFR